MEGGSLADRLSKGRPSRQESIRWIADIADALEYAHLNKIIHRDIKPANILLDHHGRAKLADFGIAQSAMKTGEFAPSLGTLRYMSPEQLEGKPADNRSDIYSLGIVLHEMLTGHLPYSSHDPSAIRREIVEGTASLSKSIPRSLLAFIRKATSRSPELRHGSAREFAGELRRVSTKPRGAIYIGLVPMGLLVALLFVRPFLQGQRPADKGTPLVPAQQATPQDQSDVGPPVERVRWISLTYNRKIYQVRDKHWVCRDLDTQELIERLTEVQRTNEYIELAGLPWGPLRFFDTQALIHDGKQWVLSAKGHWDPPSADQAAGAEFPDDEPPASRVRWVNRSHKTTTCWMGDKKWVERSNQTQEKVGEFRETDRSDEYIELTDASSGIRRIFANSLELRRGKEWFRAAFGSWYSPLQDGGDGCVSPANDEPAGSVEEESARRVRWISTTYNRKFYKVRDKHWVCRDLNTQELVERLTEVRRTKDYVELLGHPWGPLRCCDTKALIHDGKEWVWNANGRWEALGPGEAAGESFPDNEAPARREQWHNRSHKKTIYWAGGKEWIERDDKTQDIVGRYTELERTDAYVELSGFPFGVGRLFEHQLKRKRDGEWAACASGFWQTPTGANSGDSATPKKDQATDPANPQ